jgi:plastocyanin
MRVVKLLAVVGLLAGSLIVAAPVAAGDPCYHGFDLPDRSEGTDPQIKLMPCAFAPTIVRVAPGTTVQFFSGPDFVHLITGANQEWGSRDEEVQPESVVAYRFDRAGIYPFACALHRGMSGTIVVGDGVSSAVATGAGAAVVKIAPPADPVAATAQPAAVTPAPRAVVTTSVGSGTEAPATSMTRSMVAAILVGLSIAVVAVVVIGRRRRVATPGTRS